MLEGEAKAFHEAKGNELAERFRLIPTSLRNAPHLTLKAPFETDDVTPVDDLLDAFSMREHPQPFTLSGVGAFDLRVIYHGATFPDATRELVERFQDSLRTLPWLTFSPTETPITPHVTIAYPKNRIQAKDILARVTEESLPTFEVSLNHVALLHKPGNRWEVLRTYPLSQV